MWYYPTPSPKLKLCILVNCISKLKGTAIQSMAAAAGSMARIPPAQHPRSYPLWATWIGHLTLVGLSGFDRRADRADFFAANLSAHSRCSTRLRCRQRAPSNWSRSVICRTRTPCRSFIPCDEHATKYKYRLLAHSFTSAYLISCGCCRCCCELNTGNWS